MVPKTRSGVRPEGVAKKVNTSARKIGTPKLQLYLTRLPKPFQRLTAGTLTMPTPSWKEDFVMEFQQLWCTILPIWKLPCCTNVQEQINNNSIWTSLQHSQIQTLGQYLQAWTQLRCSNIHMWYWAWQLWWGIRMEGMQLEAIDHIFGIIWQSLPSDLITTLQHQLSLNQASTWELEWTTISILTKGLSWAPGRDQDLYDTSGIISVRAASNLMYNTQSRNKKWLKFYKLAKGINPDSNTQIEDNVYVDHIQKQFSRLWKSELLNRHKEPFWRLVYDAIPTPGRLHLRHVQCACGHTSPDRAHVFWDCPIFQVLIQHLQSKGVRPISRDMVWLAQPPPAMYIRVWEILCLLLLFVADLIRRQMVKERLNQRPQRSLEQWKRAIKTIFIKQLMDFVIITDTIPGRWDYRRLLRNPILYTYGTNLTQGSTSDSSFKLAVNI